MVKKITGLILAIILVAGFAFLSCNKDNPVEPTTGTISGVIFSASDSSVITGATVHTTPATISVTSDNNGHYTISNINAGSYTVTAGKSGYINDSVSVKVIAGNNVTMNITLSEIIPNNPPSEPSSPSPANASTDINTEVILSWVCSDPDAGDTLKYDVYCGMNNPPTTIVSTNQNETSLVQSNLVRSTTYYWKVIAKDKSGATTDGPVWYFTTVPNNPPFAPSNPSPANNASDINTAVILSWTCSDPDEGDTLKYDVYCGTTNPPNTIISSDQNATDLVKSDLVNSTTYYWKVTAKDRSGATTDGPVWYFTTVSAGTTNIEWLSIPAGEFTMGSLFTDLYAQTDEVPQHVVYLDAYQISKYEITNAQYKAFMDAGGYSNSTYWTTEGWEWITTYSVTEPYWWTEGDYKSGTAFPNHPVVGVSWHEAYAFCQWIGGHLPTEAQWEKAARGTEVTNYWPWGSTWEPSKCNSYYNEFPDTFAFSAPVGSFSEGQSQYGIYDMAGNVWEWVNDWYQNDYYSVSPYSNPLGPDTGEFRVFRGGGWGNIGDYLCRSADRRYHNMRGSNGVIGFRPAK